MGEVPETRKKLVSVEGRVRLKFRIWRFFFLMILSMPVLYAIEPVRSSVGTESTLPGFLLLGFLVACFRFGFLFIPLGGYLPDSEVGFVLKDVPLNRHFPIVGRYSIPFVPAGAVFVAVFEILAMLATYLFGALLFDFSIFLALLGAFAIYFGSYPASVWALRRVARLAVD